MPRLSRSTGSSRGLKPRITTRAATRSAGARQAIHTAILKAALDAVIVMDEDGTIVELNGAAEGLFGYRSLEAAGSKLADLVIPPRLREQHARGLARYLATGRAKVIGRRVHVTALRRSGEEFPVELAIAEIAGTRRRRLFAGYIRDLTERRREEALGAGQGEILEQIAAGAPLEETLAAIVRLIEANSPGVLASVLLLDADGVHARHGAAGSLPPAYWKAIDGAPIGPRAGSCGTAMHRRAQVIVEDLRIDPLWSDYRALAEPHGLRACWSTPILDPQRRVLGSFALYQRSPGRPGETHLRLIEMGTHTAALAIQKTRDDARRRRAEESLRESEQRYRGILESMTVGFIAIDRRWRLTYVNARAAEIVGRPAEALVGKTFLEAFPEAAGSPFEADYRRAMEERVTLMREQYFEPWKRWFEVRVDPSPEGIAIFFRDVTEQKRSARELDESQKRYQRLVEVSPEAIWVLQDEKFAFANRAALELFGAGSPAELLGRPVYDLTHPDFHARAAARLRAIIAEERAANPRAEHVLLRVDGTPIDVELASVRFTLEGRPAVQVIARDITERKRSVEALHRFRTAMDASGDAILLIDRASMRYIDVNRTFCELVGYSREEVIGMTPMEVFSADRATLERDYDAIISGGDTAATRVEGHYRRKDGSIVPIETRRRAIRTEDGWVIVGTARDISERKAAEQRIEYLATHDGLTDLPNRGMMNDRITQAMAHARRVGRQLAVMYLDLDRFKVVNDGYGHAFGDALLKATAARLAEVVREGDTVARQGGDEFLVLLSDLRRSADVYVVAQKVLEALGRPFTIDGREVHVGASIGVSLFPQDGQTAQALVTSADVAMYRAKELGGNSYQFFTRAMSEESQRRIELETRLRVAAAKGELHLAYQPKVELASGRISGCEALLRWTQPELGAVSPARFIPVAEESGLIVPVGDWVLRTACAQNKAWLEAGLPPVAVSVNVSARQFLQQDVVSWVMKALADTGLPPERLELELTESLIAQDVEQVIDTINRLKAAGVRLSIDDFGTGYSSLAYLKRFRVDTLKIDQSFVRNMLAEADDAAIVNAIVSLAESLKLRVIAEGVETAEHARFLQRIRCHEIQGYYFSRPVPAEEFAAMLRAGRQLQLA